MQYVAPSTCIRGWADDKKPAPFGSYQWVLSMKRGWILWLEVAVTVLFSCEGKAVMQEVRLWKQTWATWYRLWNFLEISTCLEVHVDKGSALPGAGVKVKKTVDNWLGLDGGTGIGACKTPARVIPLRSDSVSNSTLRMNAKGSLGIEKWDERAAWAEASQGDYGVYHVWLVTQKQAFGIHKA